MQEAQIGDTGKAVIDQTVMVFGQMNEPPGARLRVGLSNLAISSWMMTVLPTPAPPNRPALPPRTSGQSRSITLMPVSNTSLWSLAR